MTYTKYCRNLTASPVHISFKTRISRHCGYHHQIATVNRSCQYWSFSTCYAVSLPVYSEFSLEHGVQLSPDHPHFGARGNGPQFLMPPNAKFCPRNIVPLEFRNGLIMYNGCGTNPGKICSSFTFQTQTTLCIDNNCVILDNSEWIKLQSDIIWSRMHYIQLCTVHIGSGSRLWIIFDPAFQTEQRTKLRPFLHTTCSCYCYLFAF